MRHAQHRPHVQVAVPAAEGAVFPYPTRAHVGLQVRELPVGEGPRELQRLGVATVLPVPHHRLEDARVLLVGIGPQPRLARPRVKPTDVVRSARVPRRKAAEAVEELAPLLHKLIVAAALVPLDQAHQRLAGGPRHRPLFLAIRGLVAEAVGSAPAQPVVAHVGADALPDGLLDLARLVAAGHLPHVDELPVHAVLGVADGYGVELVRALRRRALEGHDVEARLIPPLLAGVVGEVSHRPAGHVDQVDILRWLCRIKRRRLGGRPQLPVHDLALEPSRHEFRVILVGHRFGSFRQVDPVAHEGGADSLIPGGVHEDD